MESGFLIAFYVLPFALGLILTFNKRKALIKLCLMVPAFFFLETFVLGVIHWLIPYYADASLLEISGVSIFAALNMMWVGIYLIPIFVFGLVAYALQSRRTVKGTQRQGSE